MLWYGLRIISKKVVNKLSSIFIYFHLFEQFKPHLPLEMFNQLSYKYSFNKIYFCLSSKILAYTQLRK